GLDMVCTLPYGQDRPFQSIAVADPEGQPWAAGRTEGAGMTDYEDLRQRHLADLAALMPGHVQRLRWPAERLAAERCDRLRDLLRVAIASSPWHRERLAGGDPDSFEGARLADLPSMTKDDLLANWT